METYIKTKIQFLHKRTILFRKDNMKKIKGFSTTWWITEIIGLIVFLTSVISTFISSCLPFIASDNRIFEKMIYMIGLIFVYIGLYYFYEEFVKCLRSLIRNNKKTKTTYSQEKIDIIKTQMENSVTHLYDKEED